MEAIISESITARLVSDKPVIKTPYQVKGVFMKQFPDEKIIPFLDGRLRSKYLYPRVQVKILNEQIYIVGLNEGVEPVLALIKNLDSFNFGDITLKIEEVETEQNNDPVMMADKLLRYKFITPWVALNAGTNRKYKNLVDEEKILFLNKLLGQNLLFLSKELGLNIDSKIYTKVEVQDIEPNKHDENGWRSFDAEFKTNFMLPSYIGFGNGITRGYGSIFSLNHISNLESAGSDEDYDQEEINADDEFLSFVTINDAPVINKRKKKKRFKGKKKRAPNNSNPSPKGMSRKKGNNFNKKEADIDDDSRFNSEEYHKKQHKF